MGVLFYLGLGLLGVAFVSGAAEIAARAAPGMNGIVISAYDLWHTLSPTSLVHAHIVIQRNIGQWLWDPALKTVMKLPAWFLFGAPGASLAWFCNPLRHSEGKGPIDEEDFFLLDALDKKAREDGYGDGKHDPGHSLDVSFAFDDDQDKPDKSEKEGYEDNAFLLDELSKKIVNGEYVETDDAAHDPPPKRDGG
ncbi:MAG: hypothetical protein A3G18_06610 [Rhodospirillales bacterium RIFCSPLOWO2_12_FULL_58_28]|nr:MAG: hypothetical protein A3H92_06355 [Rhodospirillales bacterium RIFCSPLOWO2_02_FULL_58_16]OHC79375.1 MAG: hypothetical protein A3G18_06610 [Rhodospirillales bacterium RIFCSPLOWO2_12_FULL_58_28]